MQATAGGKELCPGRSAVALLSEGCQCLGGGRGACMRAGDMRGLTGFKWCEAPCLTLPLVHECWGAGGHAWLSLGTHACHGHSCMPWATQAPPGRYLALPAYRTGCEGAGVCTGGRGVVGSNPWAGAVLVLTQHKVVQERC